MATKEQYKKFYREHGENEWRKEGPGYDAVRSKIKDKSTGAILDEIQKYRKQNGVKGPNLGEFDEAPGGGTPKQDGGGRGAMHKNFVVADSPKDPRAIAAKAEGLAVRYQQPRAEDGTFEKNSANAKELSTEESRGKRGSSWLAGVEVPLKFLKKGAVFILRGNEGKVERLINAVDFSIGDLHRAVSVYLDDERGFAGIVGATITKKGRKSKFEQFSEDVGETGKIDQLSERQLGSLSEGTKQRMQQAEQSVRNRIKPANDIRSRQKPSGTRMSRNNDRPGESKTASSSFTENELNDALKQMNSIDGYGDMSMEEMKSLIDDGYLTREDFGFSSDKTGSGSKDKKENDIKKSMGLDEEDDE